MPVINSVAARTDDVQAWRRAIHAHPELGFDVHQTAATVADLLRSFGCDDVVTGIGQTGVVGVIRGQSAGRTIGLRTDMDALPITEATGRDYASAIAGKMHACGHDGHTAMLLGAARHLCETRQFAGTTVVVFQPAEEGGAGGRAMVRDGLMERFGIEEIYGMHNLPGLPVGVFALRPGPIMAATDRLEIEIEGKGGHAAAPHLCNDPVLAGALMVSAIQGIVARNVDPLEAAVISVTQFNAGTASNIIPQSARLGGTLRTLKAETFDTLSQRLDAVVQGIASAQGVTAKVTIHRGYPVTKNHPDQTLVAAGVARQIGTEVDTDAPPIMGAEDFSYMLEARPGAFIFTGNGETAGLHHPEYDFDDAVLPYGISYWVRLVETALPA